MSEKAVTEQLDHLLKPLGFMRQKTAWNRRSGYVVEVIEVQVSKVGDSATVNAGVLDTEAYVTLWGSEPPEFVEELACTVRARVGELTDGNGNPQVWGGVKDAWGHSPTDWIGNETSTDLTPQILESQSNRMDSAYDWVFREERF